MLDSYNEHHPETGYAPEGSSMLDPYTRTCYNSFVAVVFGPAATSHDPVSFISSHTNLAWFIEISADFIKTAKGKYEPKTLSIGK